MQLRHASPLQLALRRARRAQLAAARLARWALDDELAAPERVTPGGPIAMAMRVPITRAGAHPRLEAGKRHNLMLAATAFHGVVVAADRPMSFWRTLGPATAARGFTWGMELRSGCAVPAIGGGLCLLSNALFTLAVERGWRILERAGHSVALAEPGAYDATVAFPHVDLRIAPREGRAVLGVTVRGDVLVIELHHDGAPLLSAVERAQRDDGVTRFTRIRRRVYRELVLVEDSVIVDDRQAIPEGAIRTCLDCAEITCHAGVELRRRSAPREDVTRPAIAADAAAGRGPGCTVGPGG